MCITRYGLKSENTAVNMLSNKNAKNDKNEPLKYIYKKRKKPAGNIIIKKIVRRLFGPDKYIKTLKVPVIINNYNHRINNVNQVN